MRQVSDEALQTCRTAVRVSVAQSAITYPSFHFWPFDTSQACTHPVRCPGTRPSHIPGRAIVPGRSLLFVDVCRDSPIASVLQQQRPAVVSYIALRVLLGVAAVATLPGYLPRWSTSTCTSTAVSEASRFSSLIAKGPSAD